MKKVIVISFGGSILVPKDIDKQLIKEFKKVLLKNKKNYKFVVVCGGGSIARVYIRGLEDREVRKKIYLQGILGIAVTRLNAKFMTYFFGENANQKLPMDMKDIESLLRIKDIVFCGALRYEKNETSDATSAKIANHFNTIFVNLTNVQGLYDKDPKKFKNAKFIPEISSEKFLKMFKEKFKPGQHFILDKNAAKIINKYKIPTYVLSRDMQNLDNFLNNKHFIGTIIF